ncbi:MAG: hypothetical protein KatS3mg031_1583 [Chitinophagales bacterium]|nr:MAG: hypothetical protein KatS3mg031_1583 [Chitinophagales bacterium]
MANEKTTTTKKLGSLFVKLVLIWLSWKVFIWIAGEESTPVEDRMFPAFSAYWEQLNDWLRIVILHAANWLLHMLGYETVLEHNYVLRVLGHRGIALGNYCLGFQLMYYFIMLVMISDLSWPIKVFASITGVVLIQVMNILRVAGLNLIDVHYNQYMVTLSHDYIFNFLVFGLLLLFYYWLLKMSSR